MTPDDIQRALQLRGGNSSWREGWERTQADFATDRLTFLDPDEFRRLATLAQLSTNIAAVLAEAARAFAGHEPMARLLWHYHVRMFRGDSQRDARKAAAWPVPAMEVHPWAGLFFPVLLVSGVETVWAYHRRHGVPEAVTRVTLGELDSWTAEYHRRHRRWGFDRQPWLVGHYGGDLYRLGRLNFRFDPFQHDLHVYRRKNDGAVAAFPTDGAGFRHDGQYADADGQVVAPAFVATFVDDGERLAGHPITPRGAVCPEPIELPRGDYIKVLEKGAPVLTVHIPKIGPMDHDACGRAFGEAMAFFPRHFPDRPFAAFGCTSWLLDPQFESMLPERSNIYKFLLEYFLHPVTGARDADFYERVFGWNVKTLDDAPRETSLQRIVAGYIEQGGRWRNGGGFILRNDLDWGARVYRRPGKVVGHCLAT